MASMRFVKTTVLGGLLFLVPLAVGAFLLGQAFAVIREVVLFVDEYVPGTLLDHPVLLNVAVIAVLVVLCFVAGLFARSAPGRRLGQRLENWLLGVLPGYSFVKGVTDGLRQNEERSRDFVPVIAHLDDCSQLAFEVERTPKDRVVLYLPGCPDPWSGSVIYVTPDRVEALDMTVPEALKNLRGLGRGSSEYADRRA